MSNASFGVWTGLTVRALNDASVPPKRGYSRGPRTKLARQRARARFEQDELADRAGVPLRTLQRFEAGEVPNAILQLVALADALGCTLNDLIEDHWHRSAPPGGTRKS